MYNKYMKLFKTETLVRDISAGHLLENFFVSAVLSIVTIRVYLYITGYPQIGGETIHIAHVLFGGFLMLIALTCQLAFLNREFKTFASVVGGMGFGTFIDELGKFITHDNNYFYQPAIALVYIIFVLLFLIFRAIEKSFTASPTEYAVNALEFVKEAILHDFDKQEKEVTRKLLSESNPNDPIIIALKKSLREIQVVPTEDVNIIIKFRRLLRKLYKQLIAHRFFVVATTWFFVIATFINFFPSINILFGGASVIEWGIVLSSGLSAILVIVGINYLRVGKRYVAYEYFKWSVLVVIFLRQFFVFYQEQFSALFGLVVNILILSVLQYVIEQELLIGKKKLHVPTVLEEIQILLTEGEFRKQIFKK